MKDDHIELVKNTTRFPFDIGFSENNRQMPKQFPQLLAMDNQKVAVVQTDSTGFDFSKDSIIAINVLKVSFAESPLYWYPERLTLYISPSSQHSFAGFTDKDLLPDKSFKYMGINKEEFLQKMITVGEARVNFLNFIADCKAIIMYRNSEQKGLWQLIPKPEWKAKIKTPIFMLQNFYKNLDQGLIPWQYGINGLLWRLKISARANSDKNKSLMIALAVYKLIHIYRNIDLGQNKIGAKSYDKMRPIVKDIVMTNNNETNGIKALLKERSTGTLFYFIMTTSKEDYTIKPKIHAVDLNGELLDLTNTFEQVCIREISIKVNAQYLMKTLDEMPEF